MTKTQDKIHLAKSRQQSTPGAKFFWLLRIGVLELFVLVHKIASLFVVGKHRTFEKFARKDERGVILDSFTKHERFHRVSMSSAFVVGFVSVTYVVVGVFAPGPYEIHAASLTVTDNSDSGDGTCDSSCTLRDALTAANASPGPDAITFDSPMLITPTSALPNITEGLQISGDVDSNGVPDVVLNGASAGTTNALNIVSDDNTVSGLVIQGFSGSGIVIQGSGNTISGNYIGTNELASAANANTTDGIVISDDTVNPSTGNVIGGNSPVARNIISGNSAYGLRLSGSLVENNTIAGNFIGTNGSGNASIANGSGGIRIENNASGNIIGGDLGGANTGEAPGNIISGNSSNAGIALLSPSNQVSGNIIGLIANGTTALPNAGGITISAASNTIGGNTPSHRNIISGNAGHGISQSAGATTTIRYNYIGIDMAGTIARGNSTRGINVVGGDQSILDNVISGNATGIQSSGASTLVIQGNKIGTNAAGSAAVSGSENGIYILNGNVTVGGTSISERNLISGNTTLGIAALTSSPRVTITGNYIGTDVTGENVVANDIGIAFAGGATGNVVGGNNTSSSCIGSCNVISGNTTNDVRIDSGSHANLVQGNYIGANALGTKPLVWTQSGTKASVLINDGSYANEIGGNRDENLGELGEGNLLVGNQQASGAALRIVNNAFNGTTGNPILGNLIGVSPLGSYQDVYDNISGAASSDGINDFGNVVGVECSSSEYCTVGDGTEVHRNLISGNKFGIRISNSPNSSFDANYIGTNKTGTLPLSTDDYQGQNGLHFGLYFTAGNSETGSIVRDNVISGFYTDAPDFSGDVASNEFGAAIFIGEIVYPDPDISTDTVNGVTFIRNKIGTDKAGNSVLRNNVGIFCLNGSNLVIGGADPSDANIISGNGESLVGGPFETVASGLGYCRTVTIRNNYFGTDASGNTSLRNGNAIIFNSSAGEITFNDNVVGGSDGQAVKIDSAAVNLDGNNIGVGINDVASIGNSLQGLLIESSGSLTIQNNRIQNNTEEGVAFRDATAILVQDNTISGNVKDGLFFDDSNNATILSNSIVDNGENGIRLAGSSDFVVGSFGDANTISGHSLNGIRLESLSHDNAIEYNIISSNSDLADGNGAGVFILESFLNSISNNSLEDNTIGVVLSSANSAATYQNTVDSNQITGSLRSGVLVQYARTQGNAISNNTISANNAYGIENVTTHSQSYPVPAGGDNEISSNTITLNTLSGIRNFGASPLIEDNSLSQNSEHGIKNLVSFGADTNPDTASDDVLSEPTITGNTFNSNASYGMYSLDTAPTNKLTVHTDNTFDGGNVSGRVRQEWYGLVAARSEDDILSGASTDIFDNSGDNTLASIASAANGYAPNSASTSDVQTWQVIPEFQVSPTGTLQQYAPHRVRVSTEDDSETVTFDFDGTVNASNVGPEDFGNINGRYQVALVNITKAPNTISGTVYEDSNDNGVRDDGEVAKSGVEISIHKSSDAVFGGDDVFATTTSAADGTYILYDVAQGNYFVEITEPTDFSATTSNPASVIVFAAEDEAATRDFGLLENSEPPAPVVESGTIRGTVFVDVDKDKIYDGNESGLSEVQIQLYADSNGNGTFDAQADSLLSTRTTNNSGVYRFIGIGLRDYFLAVTTPDGRIITTENSPTNLLELDAQGEIITVDFGVSPQASAPTEEPTPDPTPDPETLNNDVPVNNNTGGPSGTTSDNNTVAAPRSGAGVASSIVAIALGALSLANLIAAAGTNILLLLRLLLDLFTEPLLALFGAKKSTWGRLLDSTKNLPLDLGIARLYDSNSFKLVGTAVTDRTGRFKFIPKAGRYYIKAFKRSFLFPSALYQAAPTYQKPTLYFGDSFTIDEQVTSFGRDIPMDPVETKDEAKVILKLRTKQILHTTFAFSGTAISIVNMLIVFSWLTVGIFILHLVLLVIFWRLSMPSKPKSWGRVYDEESKQPIHNATIRIYDQKFGRLLDVAISSRNGTYGFLVGPGEYYIVAEAPEYIFPAVKKASDKDYLGGTISVMENKGILFDIPLRKERS